MDLPFDGAISAYFENDAPAPINKAIKRADKDDILATATPIPNVWGASNMTARWIGSRSNWSSCKHGRATPARVSR